MSQATAFLLLSISNVSAKILWPLLKQVLGRKHDFTHAKNNTVTLLKAFFIIIRGLLLVIRTVSLSLELTATKIFISQVFDTVKVSKQPVIYVVAVHLGVWKNSEDAIHTR